MESQHIPFNRTVPISYLSKVSLINLVRNPNYKNREYIKLIKIKDERLECLKNKTIHIGYTDAAFYQIKENPFASLLENIAILVHNTKELSTKIVYYNYEFSGYEKKYFDDHGIRGSKYFNLHWLGHDYFFKEPLFQSMKRESDDVYLLYDLKYEPTASRTYHIVRNLCALGVVKGRKHVVYNLSLIHI